MNPNFIIVGFWIGIILVAISYIFRKKSFSKLFFQMGAAALFISIIIFVWWGITRNLG